MSRQTHYKDTHCRIHSEQGFTLLEMLVAIAIVAILVALLFPALSRIRESANFSGCLVSMRKIDTGLQSYLAENNFIYHSAYWQWPDPASSIPPGGGNAWFSASPDGQLTGSYVLSSNTELRNINNPLNCHTAEKRYGSYYIDYAYNLSLAGISKASIHKLSEMVTVVEGGDDARVTSGASSPAHPQFLPGGTAYFLPDVLVPVHKEKCNILFADGHVELLAPDTLQGKNFNPFLQND